MAPLINTLAYVILETPSRIGDWYATHFSQTGKAGLPPESARPPW